MEPGSLVNKLSYHLRGFSASHVLAEKSEAY